MPEPRTPNRPPLTPSLPPQRGRRRGSFPGAGRGACVESYNRAVILRVALLLFALAVAGVASSAVLGSGNPTGKWATPQAALAVILSRTIEVGECAGGACQITNGKLVGEPTSGRVSRVVSATVTGIGPYKLINGVRRYQLFNVRACTIYYYKGAHRWDVHFRWFTRRPPGGTIRTSDRNGGVTDRPDTGAPYARDWNYPLFAPLARDRC